MIKDKKLANIFIVCSICICITTVIAMTALWDSGYAVTDRHKEELLAHIDKLSVSQGEALININTADEWMLQKLPSIGKVRAKAIIDYRTRIGSYTRIEQLLEVKGITQSIFDKIKEDITV